MDHSLPATSPSKPAILQVSCEGIGPSTAAEIFNVHTTTIHKANKIQDGQRLRHILKPVIQRDRISTKKPTVLEFLECNVMTPSGRDKKYYFGTPRSMYQKYKQYCITNRKASLGFKVFHHIRKAENIGIIQGDQFSERDKQMWLDIIDEELKPLLQQREMSKI